MLSIIHSGLLKIFFSNLGSNFFNILNLFKASSLFDIDVALLLTNSNNSEIIPTTSKFVRSSLIASPPIEAEK